jgi:HK97 gp10 family phage protein
MAEKKPLKRLQEAVTQRINKSVEEMAELLKQRIEKNASLTDHSLDELEKLGHPYAVRNTGRLHNLNYQVHKQSGKLVDNIFLRKKGARTYVVGVDESQVPYVGHVINGTRYMVPRDFVGKSLKELNKELKEKIEADLKESVDEADET